MEKLMTITESLLQTFGLEEYRNSVMSFLHFIASLSLVEYIVLGLICLLVLFLILGLFLKLFRGIANFIGKLFGRKGKQIARESVKGKIVLPKSLDYKNGILSTTFNYARFFKGMIAMARIEEDIKKDKPVRLNLSQAIFMIQNFGHYNYFASEDGKVLFEKIKRDIDSDKKDMFAIPEQQDIKDNIFTLDRLQEIIKDDVRLEFNEDGNLVGFINKQEEQQKIGAEIAREISNVLEPQQEAKTPQENIPYLDYAKWQAQSDEKNIQKIPAEKAPKEAKEKPLIAPQTQTPPSITPKKAQKPDEKDTPQLEAGISARELKKQASKNKKELKAKESEEKIEVVEMDEALEKLGNIDMSDFYDASLIDLNTQATTGTNKKRKENNKTDKHSSGNNDTAQNQKGEHIAPSADNSIEGNTTQDSTLAFIQMHCTSDDVQNGLIYFDKEQKLLLFKKTFFIKLGKPVLAEREQRFWSSIEKKYSIRFVMNAECQGFSSERLIGLSITHSVWVEKNLCL